MRIIEQSAEIQDWTHLNLYERVEIAARVCRRSECKGNAEEFVRGLVRSGHYSPLEFARVRTEDGESENVRRIREMPWQTLIARLKASYPSLVEEYQYLPDVTPIEPDDNWIPVLFVTSRTISHQLVRYRQDICFMQESQRHMRYDKTGIEVIEPPGLDDFSRRALHVVCERAEYHYATMIKHGATAEQARAVLPGCTATRILAYASPDEWRHIFSQRCTPHADPQMRVLMEPLQARMLELRLI